MARILSVQILLPATVYYAGPQIMNKSSEWCIEASELSKNPLKGFAEQTLSQNTYNVILGLSLAGKFDATRNRACFPAATPHNALL
jgi:hypothetical protein